MLGSSAARVIALGTGCDLASPARPTALETPPATGRDLVGQAIAGFLWREPEILQGYVKTSGGDSAETFPVPPPDETDAVGGCMTAAALRSASKNFFAFRWFSSAAGL